MDGQANGDGGESGVEPATEVKPEGLKTRRECAIFGGYVFAAAVFGAVALAGISAIVVDHGDLWLLVRGVVIAAPPAFAVGILISYQVYRLTVGSRPWAPMRWWGWIFCLLCLGWFAILLFLGYHQREQALVMKRTPRWGFAVFFYIVAFCLAILLPIAGDGDGALAGMFYGGLVALFLADSVVVNMIARWRNEGRLAPPESHKFQYSLGTLVLFVWGFGAWMTAVVLMFR